MILMSSRQADQFHILQDTMTKTLAGAIREQFEMLPRWPETLEATLQKFHAQKSSNSNHQGNNSQKRTNRNLRPVLLKSSPVSTSFVELYAKEYADKLADVEEEAWESLSFPIIKDREDQISEADLATFNWIFEEPRNVDRPWSSFLNWLKSANSLYWISGKAGSGKSTLMKHLFADDRTHQALKQWAADEPLIIANFFFWNTGTSLQKSQIGLLRALLHQCLANHRELIPIILSDASRSKVPDLSEFWTLPRLKDALHKLLQQQQRRLKICFFIDGLDEYEGSHIELARLLEEVTDFPHVKICASSRPLLPFESAFQCHPGLILQNLTFEDIKSFVSRRMDSHDGMKTLELEEPGITTRLTQDIVTKASGVFLWVKLVVNSLMEGLSNYDRGPDLLRRLEELPDDLEDLYSHMLDRVKPAWYLEEGFRLLLVQAAVLPLTVLQLCFADMEIPHKNFAAIKDGMTLERQSRLCDAMAGRIKSRCLGLLELSGLPTEQSRDRRVQFLHKGVTDFLESPSTKARISQCIGKTTFVPELCWTKSILLELHTIKTRLKSQGIRRSRALKREAFFDQVYPLVKLFVRYTWIAEHATGIASVDLVDELNRIATDLWTSVRFKSAMEGTLYWSGAPRNPSKLFECPWMRSKIRVTYDDIQHPQNSQRGGNPFSLELRDSELEFFELLPDNNDISINPDPPSQAIRSRNPSKHVRFLEPPQDSGSLIEEIAVYDDEKGTHGDNNLWYSTDELSDFLSSEVKYLSVKGDRLSAANVILKEGVRQCESSQTRINSEQLTDDFEASIVHRDLHLYAQERYGRSGECASVDSFQSIPADTDNERKFHSTSKAKSIPRRHGTHIGRVFGTVRKALAKLS